MDTISRIEIFKKQKFGQRGDWNEKNFARASV